MPPRYKFSLSTKITAAILISLIFVFTIIASAMWIGSSRYIDQTRITITEFSRDEATHTMDVLHSVLKHKGESLTGFLSEISAIKIISFDYETLKQYLNNILKDHDVVYAIYHIEANDIVISRHIPLAGTPWSNMNKKGEDILALTSQMKKDGYVAEYKKDIFYNNVKIGTIIVGISRENVIELHKQAVRNLAQIESSLHIILQDYFKKFGLFIILVYAAAFLLISTNIYFIIRALVLRKLEVMATGFSKVASGYLDRKIEINSSDEIGDLCNSFNNMTTSLQKEMADRLKIERNLRESEDRYRDLMENSTDFVMKVSPNAELLYANRAWQENIGYSREELSDKSVMEIIHPECQLTCMEKFKELLSGEEPGTIDTVFVTKGGRKINVEGKCNCKFIDGKPAYIRSIFRDVTERNQMQEQLQKAQKLESVGLLAGGIAHDFNNLLAGLHGLISVVKSSLAGQEKQVQLLNEAQNACMRGKDLTSKFITFAEGGTPFKREMDIHNLLKDSVNTAMSSFEMNCNFDIADDLWMVEIDHSQIQQAINNLVVNGCESMQEGGTLTVRSRNCILGKKDGLPLEDGKYVRIDIEDQGTGITAEDLPKIFDPYFTTKPMASKKGTGFGLSICYSIIKKHHGEITVDSEDGAGTSFHIYIPAISKDEFGSEKKAP
ncbi:MAG: PAS domain S-box protein [Desulfobulbaceae bacterium]|uniref:histidine kinase n=1 Tax=Candidatus Desulfobia pelagia TaxID=2841692 RepID=A0A8J6NE67_9BACT|nr:PAS domain S-box protein [Candidatus Desulfobia pelagia]